ncbi:MAG: hypothetical protein L3J75_15810 [Methylococcaceae bacterium]|nr:hypothetical protein [Methylococcaceae bacterium]
MAENRGLLGDSWAFTEALGEGVWDAGTGMVKGLGDLAKGGYELATEANARESAWETTKQLADAAADYGKSVIENPGEAYRYARDGTLAAYDRFEQAKDLAAAEGRSAEFFGDMAGGALFEVGSILVPVGLVAKAGKLGKVASVAEDVADVAKTAKKVENAEEVLGATQKAKAASVNPVIKEFDDKVSPIQRCPIADSDVGRKNIDVLPLRQKIKNLSPAEQKLVKNFDAGFTPLGVSKEGALDFILNTKTGKEQLKLAKLGDPSADHATILNRVLEQVESGVSVPVKKDITTPLVKIVPENRTSAGSGPFFTTPEQLEIARSSGKPLSDVFGLPGGSDAERFRVFQINPKGRAAVFESTIAPTSELGGKLKTQGGLQQFLAPNRNQFEDAVEIGLINDNF